MGDGGPPPLPQRGHRVHQSMDTINPLLPDMDWEMLQLIDPILETFILAQKELEGARYVTGSFTILTIGELRDGLKGAMDDLSMVTTRRPSDATSRAMGIVAPDAKSLWGDFINRWCEGRDILEYKEGRRWHPQIFKRVQVCVTALDPRCKDLYGIRPQEHAAVWKAVSREAVKLTL